ncbi:hypothetical protein V8E53_001632 [Lactarius tabidus]
MITFLEELHTWLAWVERWVQGDGRELEVIREEHGGRWQAHLQHCTEPPAEALLATSSALQGTIPPLGVLQLSRTKPQIVQLGKNRGIARRIRHESVGEAWEHDLSSDDGIDLKSDNGTRKMYAALVQDQGPKQPTLLPPLNNPTPEQAFFAKNYDENARRADCDPRGIFRTPTAAPAAGLVRPLRSSSFSVQTVEHALAEVKGSSDATLGGIGRPVAAPTSPILGSAASPTQHELLLLVKVGGRW